MTESSPLVEIFTDGACSGNPGPGGWGVLLRLGNAEKELSGGEALTTNNRMEMMAGISEWLPGWIARGWKTADKKPVKNADLWQRLDAARKAHKVDFIWVRGHNGHPENERVDALAVAAIKRG